MQSKCSNNQLRFISKLSKAPVFTDTRKIDIKYAPKNTHIKVLRELVGSYEISVVACFGEKSINNVQLGEHGIILKDDIKKYWKEIKQE